MLRFLTFLRNYSLVGAVIILILALTMTTYYARAGCKSATVERTRTETASGTARANRFKNLTRWSEFQAEHTPDVLAGVMLSMFEECARNTEKPSGRCERMREKWAEFFARHERELLEVAR